MVRYAVYFTNRKGGRSCLFKWSKPLFVKDIYTTINKQHYSFMKRKKASLFQELKHQRTQQGTWFRKVCEREKDEKNSCQKAANSDVVGAQPFMTTSFQPMALSQGFVSTLIIVSSPNTNPSFGKQSCEFLKIHKLKKKRPSSRKNIAHAQQRDMLKC
ncbi:hypothetical protein AABB24_005818 [Solanum stoloniferum]|uniref:Uncharacterized protein n=1 Tax=Solanum stoloniferum TaxID=62892 RepID=A0ABD2V012_9SOLN